MKKINNKQVKINYDTGNSASLNYDFDSEIREYKKFILDIHIKDRIKNGHPVLLGNGNWDFKKFFNYYNKDNFCKLLILQAFRDEDGYKIFKKQLQWFRKKLSK